jgi:hypothetical protein
MTRLYSRTAAEVEEREKKNIPRATTKILQCFFMFTMQKEVSRK